MILTYAKWTKGEIEYLKAHYTKDGAEKCSKYLGRPYSSITHKASRLGLKKGSAIRHAVSPEIAEKVVAKRKQGKIQREIAEEMGLQLLDVQAILKHIGLNTSKIKKHERFSESLKDDFLNPKLSRKDILAKHKISTSSLYRFAAHFGLKSPACRLESTRGNINERRKGKTTYQLWVDKYGVEEANKRDIDLKKKRSISSSGSNNPMYGKPTPQGAGNGWKGWYKGHYFRSLREVMCMIDMDTKGLAWKSAETKEYQIEYRFMDTDRTYRPDFIVGAELWELKPVRLHETPNVVAKQEAAIKFCENRGLVYRLIDIEIDTEAIKKAHTEGLIRFDRDYEQKFLNWTNPS